jgi:hypothetical protein
MRDVKGRNRDSECKHMRNLNTGIGNESGERHIGNTARGFGVLCTNALTTSVF